MAMDRIDAPKQIQDTVTTNLSLNTRNNKEYKPMFDYKASGQSFDEFVARAYQGIPDRTTTVEDKQKAILAKISILNHPECPQESKSVLLQEIAIINDEINRIKSNINRKV